MEVLIQHQPAYTSATLTLRGSEEIRVEPGAMVAHTDGLTMTTKAEGGFMAGLSRMIAGENFFVNTWQAPASGGELIVAPSLPGDMMTLDIDGEMYLKSGAFVAGEMNVKTDASWGGARGFFGGGGLVLLKVTGQGRVVISSYGAIVERVLKAGERFVIDTGHIVAFENSLDFQVTKSGTWKSTILGGEGFVCALTGPGRVFMQTRSEEAFLGWLVPKLPKSSN